MYELQKGLVECEATKVKGGEDVWRGCGINKKKCVQSFFLFVYFDDPLLGGAGSVHNVAPKVFKLLP